MCRIKSTLSSIFYFFFVTLEINSLITFKYISLFYSYTHTHTFCCLAFKNNLKIVCTQKKGFTSDVTFGIVKHVMTEIFEVKNCVNNFHKCITTFFWSKKLFRLFMSSREIFMIISSFYCKAFSAKWIKRSDTTSRRATEKVSHARRFLFEKLKKIKDFLNRYAKMVMKNGKWRDIVRKVSFFFFSCLAEMLWHKKNDEIKVRAEEWKDGRRVFSNNASVMSFVEFLFVMLNR